MLIRAVRIEVAKAIDGLLKLAGHLLLGRQNVVQVEKVLCRREEGAPCSAGSPGGGEALGETGHSLLTVQSPLELRRQVGEGGGGI